MGFFYNAIEKKSEGAIFGKVPFYVDPEKKAGYSFFPTPGNRSQDDFKANVGIVIQSLPSLVIGAIIYLLFPYQLSPAAEINQTVLVERLLLNVITVFSFTGMVSYVVNAYGKRKFCPENFHPPSSIFHNVFFTFLGTVQWTMWEILFIHLWKTGKLAYISDDEMFSSFTCMGATGVALLVCLSFRGIHFYLCHRLIHVRALYRFIHALHHRNSDIEPFAGLSMHPIEHMYYFTGFGLILYVAPWIPLSPFILHAIGMNHLLGPAISHSGFEDHFGSDQLHYLHHAKFECNYSAASLDNAFGTFRSSLSPNDNSYSGSAEDVTTTGIVESNVKEQNNDQLRNRKKTASNTAENRETALKVTAVRSAKFGLVPKTPDLIYYIFTLFLLCFILNELSCKMNQGSNFSQERAFISSSILAFGPIVASCYLHVIFTNKSEKRKSWSYPFHKEENIVFSMHVILAIIVSVVPVGHALFLALR